MKQLRIYSVAASLTAVIMLASVLPNEVRASGSKQFPDRCAYAVAAAAHRFANVVSAQVTRLDAARELPIAQSSLRLTTLLGCPTAITLKAIDCAVRRVQDGKGALPEGLQIVKCVENASGKPFPKLGK